MEIKKLFAKARKFALHILLPRTCFCCGKDMAKDDGNLLCPVCLADLKPIDGPFCLRCGLPLKDGGAHCYNCRGAKTAAYKCSMIRSSLQFTRAARALVHAFKYERYVNIAPFFVALMHKTYLKNPEYLEADMFVPVPIHKSRLKERGFNQSALLAEGLAALSGVPCLDILSRDVKTKTQTSLDKKGRLENIKGAFSCKDKKQIKGKAVILIDDVCTTGATLEECARVLKESGAREVLALSALRE